VAELTWTPSQVDPYGGTFALTGYDRSSYYLSTGDGRTENSAHPSRLVHLYPDDGPWRALARDRAGGQILSTLVVRTPSTTEDPQGTITQHPSRAFLWDPPYYVGNLALTVDNAPEGELAEYTIDWGGPADHPEPATKTFYATPGHLIYGQQPEGTYTATLTHLPSGASTSIEYTVAPELELSATPTSGLQARVEVTSLVPIRDEEDSTKVAITLDWGDGHEQVLGTPTEGGSATHTYAEPGEYTIWGCYTYDGSGPCYSTTVTIGN